MRARAMRVAISYFAHQGYTAAELRFFMSITDGQRVIVNSSASHLDNLTHATGTATRAGSCNCAVKIIGLGQDHFTVVDLDGTPWIGLFHEHELASAAPED